MIHSESPEHASAAKWLLACVVFEALLLLQAPPDAASYRLYLAGAGLMIFTGLLLSWRRVTIHSKGAALLAWATGTLLLFVAHRSLTDAQVLLRTVGFSAALWLMVQPWRTERRVRWARRLAGLTVGLICFGVLGATTGLDLLGPLDWTLRGGLERVHENELIGTRVPYSVPLPKWLWFKASGTALREMKRLYTMDADKMQKKGPALDLELWSKYGLPLDRGMRHLAAHAEELGETTLLVNPFLRTTVLVQAYFVPGAGGINLSGLDHEVEETLRKENISLDLAQQPESDYETARVFLIRQHGANYPRKAAVAMLASDDTLLEIVLESPLLPWGMLYPSFHRTVESAVPVQRHAPRLDAAVLDRVKASTAFVLTGTSSGSGFVLTSTATEAVIVTNAHVVFDPSSGGLTRLDGFEVVFPARGEEISHPATLLALDREADLAFLRVKGFDQAPPPLPVRPPGEVKVGTAAFVVGFPFGYRMSYEGQYPTPTVNAGRLSAVAWPDDIRSMLLPVDVGINPGNSGGPMVDATGAIIGVAVAHLPGSKLSMAVAPEALLRFAREHTSPGVPIEPISAVPPLPPEEPSKDGGIPNRKQLEGALVVVEADGKRGTGMLVKTADDRRLVIAPHALTHADSGRRRLDITVTVRPGTDREQKLTVEVLRSLEAGGVTALSFPRSVELPDLPTLSTEPLPETTPLHLLRFRQTTSSFTLVPIWRTASLSGHATSQTHGLEQIRVDAGANHFVSGGPLITPEGAVAGFATDAEPDSNITVAAPGRSIVEMLGGALRGGSLRYTYDGSQQCYLQFNLEVDDPLRQLDQVGVTIDSITETDGIVPVPDRLVSTRPTTFSTTVTSGRAVLKKLVPCTSSLLVFQLWTEHGGKRRNEQRQTVRLELTTNQPQRLNILATPLSGDVASTSENGFEEFTLPKEWLESGEACANRDSPACIAQSLHVSLPDDKTWSDLIRSACNKGQATACGVAGLEAMRRNDWAEALELHGRACTGHVARACDEVGHVLQNSVGDPEALTRSAEAYAQGCNYGDGHSCDVSGGKELKVTTDRPLHEARALTAFERGCGFGFVASCRHLGEMLAAGRGTTSSPSLALRALSHGCDLGDADSCLGVAAFQLMGRGVAETPTLALRSLHRACSLGNTMACDAVRRLYEEQLSTKH